MTVLFSSCDSNTGYGRACLANFSTRASSGTKKRHQHPTETGVLKPKPLQEAPNFLELWLNISMEFCAPLCTGAVLVLNNVGVFLTNQPGTLILLEGAPGLSGHPPALERHVPYLEKQGSMRSIQNSVKSSTAGWLSLLLR